MAKRVRRIHDMGRLGQAEPVFTESVFTNLVATIVEELRNYESLHLTRNTEHFGSFSYRLLRFHALLDLEFLCGDETVGTWLQRHLTSVIADLALALDSETDADRKEALKQLREIAMCPVNSLFHSAAVDPSSVTRSKVIGSGGFGEVLKGTLNDHEVVAIKRLRTDKPDSDSDRMLRALRNEAAVMLQLQHESVCKCRGTTSNGADSTILLEYVDGGTLFDRIGNMNGVATMSWTELLSMMAQVASALVHIHKQDIAHNDITTKNIMLDANDRAVLLDYGLSVSPITTDAMRGHTMRYAAPEVTLASEGEKVTGNSKSDVYSFGMVLVECITGDVPYTGVPHLDLIPRWAANGKFPNLDVGGHIIRSLWDHEVLLALVRECLNPDPDKRPTAQRTSDRIAEMRATCC